MFLHPSYILFFIFLILSVVFTSTANSLFTAWMGLELNLLSFIPLALHKSKYSSEAIIKYFLTQTIASMLFMSALLMKPEMNQVSLTILMFSVVLKMGAAPAHQWVPAVSAGLPWDSLYIMLSVQKVNPLVIMMFLLPYSSLHNLMIYLYIALSAYAGSVGGLTQTSLRKIMAFSSIAHIAWLLSAATLMNELSAVYLVMYWAVLLSVVYLLKTNKLFYLSQMLTNNKGYSGFLMAFALLSLGGLPPFTGFVPKVLVMIGLTASDSWFVLVPLLAGTFLSLFFYMRLILTRLTLSVSLNSHYTASSRVPPFMAFLSALGLLGPSALLLAL
nr:NADH dehydrogenase subunit 2 [Eusirus cf. giganteus clade g1]UIN24717.1 NADH dehydrogenase subunit 2 [Eusirus cf. giganteus clade g2]